ncbi:DUF7344 domain-containing protein [Halovenus sp. HT40]|uniref:DUF7344 domain-containing protein n=1 Tax=Halovenus sp. HT40 TaxID=3126691 RepID=UPI003FA5BA0D
MRDSHRAVSEYTDQSLSAIHHALRASRRRSVIGLVAHRAIPLGSNGRKRDTASRQPLDKDTVVTVRQLSREIVSIEEDVSLDQATGDPYHNVYTSLIQTHLPKLDEIGAIVYNGDRKVVTPDENLVALAMVTSITSPIAQVLFHNAIADLYRRDGESVLRDSMGD